MQGGFDAFLSQGKEGLELRIVRAQSVVLIQDFTKNRITTL